MDDLINRYRDRTVGITGGSGYLASVLIDALRPAAARILRISRRDLPPIPWVETLKADVRASDCWEAIVANADVIFHLAGNTSVYAAAKAPAESLSSTVLPIAHLVAAARAAARIPRVVFASTATVYGLTDHSPVAEDAETRPITNYDLHKLVAEKQLELSSRQGIVEGVSLRLANVYGPSSSTSSAEDRGIINKIARTALQGAPLRLYGDGNYVRDYVYIDDVVQAFIAVGATEVLGRSFNVASGTGITLREALQLVAQRAERVTGRRVPVECAPWPEEADPIEFRNFVADVSSLRDATGWRPTTSLSEGIDRTISSLVDGFRP